MVLAVLAVIGGFFGVPEVLGGGHALKAFLSPVFELSSYRFILHLSHSTEYMLMAVAITVMAIAIFYAHKLYVKENALPAKSEDELNPLHKLVYNKYWVDELYETVFTKPLNKLSHILHSIVDDELLDGVVNGTGKVSNRLGDKLRLIQNGNIGFYLFLMVMALVIILATGLV